MAVTLAVHKFGLDAQFLGPVKNVHSARHLQKKVRGKEDGWRGRSPQILLNREEDRSG
jgi:hypothetical protein